MCNTLTQDNDPVSTAPNYRFDEKKYHKLYSVHDNENSNNM